MLLPESTAPAEPRWIPPVVHRGGPRLSSGSVPTGENITPLGLLSVRLLTEGLQVRVLPEEPNLKEASWSAVPIDSIGVCMVRAAQEFKWFEQRGMQPAVLPLGFLEHHGQEFALLGFGLRAESMAGVARQANYVERGCERRQLGGAGRRELALHVGDLFLNGLALFVVEGLRN